MKGKWFSVIAILFLGVVFSCKNEPENKASEEIKKEIKEPQTARDFYERDMRAVLDDHDILMLDLNKISQSIQKLNDSEIMLDEELKEEALTLLKDAHKSMFDWMKKFNKRFPKLYLKESDGILTEEEYKERIEGLKEEKEILEKMKKDFEKSLETADALLNQG